MITFVTGNLVANVFSFTRKNSKLTVIRSLREPSLRVGDQDFLLHDLNPTLRRFNEFWDWMDAIKQHGYLRAALSVVGRSAVGAWWTLRRHSEFGRDAPERHRKRLFNFYMMRSRQWDNIKDFQNFAYKLMIGVMYLRFFGQAAYSILRDENGTPVGLDFLHGLVVPNVDATGRFRSPAFVQYPTRNPANKVEFENPRDVVYLANPDWEGSPLGGSDFEALATFTLPLDIYLQVAAREYMKNRDRPEVVYSLPADISDEAFDAFVKEMSARHAGPANLGRNPIAVQGEFDVHELSKLPDGLPYQESRKEAREEELAVAGVSGAKLGITEQMASANIREMRREFHETSMVPLFQVIEIGFYEQIHVREFEAPGWEFKFNNPDFLNAVERATVHMRYRQMGVLNPNEIRYELGRAPRPDEAGDHYENQQTPGYAPGSPPEGRPIEPDAPAQVGEPTLDDQDPVRGDQHDETPKDRLLDELTNWEQAILRQVSNGEPVNVEGPATVPIDVVKAIYSALGAEPSPEEVKELFNHLYKELER